MTPSTAVLAFSAPLLLAGCIGPDMPSYRPEPEPQWTGCAALADPVRSTLVLHEVRSGRTRTCNPGRAGQRFVPASTFKIPHALIALESGAVIDENARFMWDGRPRGVGAWDRETTLAEAIASSTVWVFQTIASRLGHAREAAALARLGYGNEDAGQPGDLRRFWLSGPLAISAHEQVGFLGRLREAGLDAHRAVQARTVAMLRLGGCGPDCTIYGKTGAVLPIDDDGVLRPGEPSLLPRGVERTGWFVGWVERSPSAGGPLLFAHNLDLALPGAMALRTTVVYDILRSEGVALERAE